MEMLHKTLLDDLREAGMESPQAEVVAAHIPDWSQFATRQELVTTRQELKQEMRHLRWVMLAGFGVVLVLPDNWIVLALEWLATFS